MTLYGAGLRHGKVATAHFQFRDTLFGKSLNSARRLQHKKNVPLPPVNDSDLSLLIVIYLDVKILDYKADVKTDRAEAGEFFGIWISDQQDLRSLFSDGEWEPGGESLSALQFCEHREGMCSNIYSA